MNITYMLRGTFISYRSENLRAVLEDQMFNEEDEEDEMMKTNVRIRTGSYRGHVMSSLSSKLCLL